MEIKTITITKPMIEKTKNQSRSLGESGRKSMAAALARF